MKKLSGASRMVLLLTALLAAFQIVSGIEGTPIFSEVYYTISFGVLLVAALLLILFGFEIMEFPSIAIIATIIPIALSLGLVAQYLPEYHIAYLVVVLIELLFTALSRYLLSSKQLITIVTSITHGTAGLIIFILPLWLSIAGTTKPIFSLVGVGGALIGSGGLLLAFLKAGKPILSRDIIFSILPGILFLMTAAFVIGMTAG
ncbi:MAG: hypothetical protein AB7T22_04655 [Calditrichaceae bacterium]